MAAGSRTLWDLLKEQVLAPKVTDAALEQSLAAARKALPVPVFWLFGKAQSGKTSLIRGLTGSPQAEIGNGFRPCTRTASSYAFPSPEERFLEFMDTRGLGEVDYNPAEDMQMLAGRAHLLIVVIKAMDHAQQCVLAPLKQIRQAHPHWPLLVVQTCLHEGYAVGQRHPESYPFSAVPFPADVPLDLARSLASQRAWFDGQNARFVAVDFTLPEDGFQPQFYGLEALWSAIEEILPLGLRAMLGQNRDARRPLRDAYFRAAHPHIVSYALAAGAAASVPVPMVDIPLVLAIQAKMFHALASIYGQQLTAQRMAEIGSTLGIGYLARMGGREVLKLIPGFGSVVAASFAGASTYALGRTLCAYFSHAHQGDLPEPAALQQLYRDEYEEGRRRLSAYLSHLRGAAPEAMQANQ